MITEPKLENRNEQHYVAIRSQATMQEDERFTGAVDLVVEIEAVDRRVTMLGCAADHYRLLRRA